MLNLAYPIRYWQTVRQVPTRQLAHRVRLRSQRAAYQRIPADLEQRWGASVAPTGRWPAKFAPVDTEVSHDPPALDGTIALVGEQHTPLTAGWRPPERSQLFRYHLHYFDWVWGLARTGDRDRFEVFWTSWRADTRPGRWDEWSPYVVSLRAWALCAVFDRLVAGSHLEDDVLTHLRACLGFLVENLERDVGGNHLLANLKALYGVALFFDDPRLRVFAAEELQAQLEVQVLADGGHYELSPSYHAKVLADLIDLERLSVAADGTELWPETIARMQAWLRAVRFPDGSLPTLGDCTPPPDGLLDAIVDRPPALTESEAAAPRVDHLEASGYVIVRPRPGAMVAIDLGPPGPVELPAHIQSDWGTFELWLDGQRIVVDPGVSSYVGQRRRWERSTAAHNTVSCDGLEQTEVWGSFRAGRRACPGPVDVSLGDDGVTVSAELGGLPAGRAHRRTFVVDQHRIRVSDQVSNVRTAYSRLTLASADDARRITSSHPITAADVEIGVGFGQRRRALQLTQHLVDSSGWFEASLCPAGGHG